MLCVEEPEKLNLIGLFVMRILEKNLQNPRQIDRIKKTDATVVITAGEMSITISIKNGQLKLQRGKTAAPDLSIEGPLESFFKFAMGANPIRLIISRKLKVSGDLLLLIKIFGLMRRSITPS